MKFSILIFLIFSFLIYDGKSARATDRKHECPLGIEKALNGARLIPLENSKARSIEPVCVDIDKLRYNESEAKIINVIYGEVFDFEINTLNIPVLALPDNKLFVLPHDFTRMALLEDFLTRELETPVKFKKSGWSNILIDDFADKTLVKKENTYCIEYTFKFPFEGQLQQCANPEAITNRWKLEPYLISGMVAYQSGVFHWKDALRKVLKECPKYHNSQCKCCIGGWDGRVPTGYWGNGSTSIAMKISNDPKPKVESYLFNERIYRGEEENAFIQVFSDGRVRSHLIGDKVYTPKELLEMAQ